ncbi:hypothetical protein L6452_32451 [Arctium lappa]|uniref:Uncharacterized protein n=1 Tax=Arctium lappa TaxID=4217 RepID=A0ACB8Z4K9_ARCLA|nr:hypothetical protein L6452_32451 [Arctium lappa]
MASVESLEVVDSKNEEFKSEEDNSQVWSLRSDEEEEEGISETVWEVDESRCLVSTPINKEDMQINGGEGLMGEMPVDNPLAREVSDLEAEKTKGGGGCEFSKASSKDNDEGGGSASGPASDPASGPASDPASGPARPWGKKDGSSKDLKAKEKSHTIDIRKGKKSESSRLGKGRRIFHIFKQMARGKSKKEGQKIATRASVQTKATRKKKGEKEMMASLSSISISNELGNKESEEGIKAFGEAIGIIWKSPRGREMETAASLDPDH